MLTASEFGEKQMICVLLGGKDTEPICYIARHCQSSRLQVQTHLFPDNYAC